MTDYREIIRLKSLEFSNVAIANSLGCSRNTVSEVLKLADEYSRAVTPQVRQAGNRLSGLTETAYASLLA